MKVANVVVKKSVEEFASQTRKVQRTFVRLASIQVGSIPSEAEFIPLAGEILLTGQETVASVLTVPPDMNYFKDVKHTKLQPAKGFEFPEKRFTHCAVVELPFTRVSSHDPFVQAQTYQPQVVLLPIWGEIELPQNAKLASVVECEGFAVSAHDKETNETYRLGYRFEGEEEINWIGLALTRRKHFKRSEKEVDDYTNAPKEFYSSLRFTTDDSQVIARISQKFGRGKKLPDESVMFTLRDQDDYDACEQIVREVTQLRQAAAINNDHAAMEALQ